MKDDEENGWNLSQNEAREKEVRLDSEDEKKIIPKP